MGQAPRIEDRTKVMIRARLRGAGAEREVCIVNLSSRGLAASADHAPTRGEIVELVVGRNNLVGQVKWSGPRRFGIAFQNRISVMSVISGEGELELGKAGHANARQGAEQVQAGARRFPLEGILMAAVAAGATFYLGGFAGEVLGAFHSVEEALEGAGSEAGDPAGVSASTLGQ
ncbi:PilZ domain-containing protein [Altererythrobacter sp. CC-YST694]|uniref:PilZ domain-containing protein n=1 Tax=Altererythrobacter sp. CC-YST694 TaxID=2755038 RepID=UPI001D031A38|nr:PilZ domain-containing protein [Altererythrobacter sp. CC-YST694]